MKQNKTGPVLNKKNEFSGIVNFFSSNTENIKQSMRQGIFPLYYLNNHLLQPWKFNEIIDKETETLLLFLTKQEIKIAESQGKEAAVLGLDKNIISSLCKMFKTIARKYIPMDCIELLCYTFDIIDIYRDAYQDAYIHQYIIQKNKEQEGLFNALSKSLSRQRDEIIALQQSKLKALGTAKNQIERQNKQRLIFLINFAHEAKLPLTIIQNTIKMVNEEAGNRKLPSLPVLENEINEFKKMIIDILDYEKILQGKILYNHDHIVNISNIVAKKIILYKEITEKNGIQLITDIQEELYVQINPQAFDRILNNIIDNGVKYNTPNGSINIKLRGNKDSVILTIMDTGIGIPVNQLQYIFKPYYQNESKKRSIQGIGAGLPIVKSILDEIAGQISIGSALNRGTTVTIAFIKEMVQEKEKYNAIQDIKLSRPGLWKNKKLKPVQYNHTKDTILMVEDNEELLALMQKKLNDKFNFFYAKEGQEALRKLKRIPKPGIIISDIMMDIMDGYEFYDHLTKTRKIKDIPFIFLTAKTAYEEKIKGLKKGAVDYIEKPFHIKELIAKINSLLAYQKQVKQNEKEKIFAKLKKIILAEKENKALYREMKYRKYNISTREKEVIEHVMFGMDNKAVADKLFISIVTVKKHLNSIYKKCHIKNRIELINLINEHST